VPAMTSRQKVSASNFIVNSSKVLIRKLLRGNWRQETETTSPEVMQSG
jgi:hypothetical protein